MLEIDLGRFGLDHALRELAYGGAKRCVFGREFKVQFRR
jgi:hypothetical protein